MGYKSSIRLNSSPIVVNSPRFGLLVTQPGNGPIFKLLRVANTPPHLPVKEGSGWGQAPEPPPGHGFSRCSFRHRGRSGDGGFLPGFSGNLSGDEARQLTNSGTDPRAAWPSRRLKDPSFMQESGMMHAPDQSSPGTRILTHCLRNPAGSARPRVRPRSIRFRRWNLHRFPKSHRSPRIQP